MTFQRQQACVSRRKDMLKAFDCPRWAHKTNCVIQNSFVGWARISRAWCEGDNLMERNDNSIWKEGWDNFHVLISKHHSVMHLQYPRLTCSYTSPRCTQQSKRCPWGEEGTRFRIKVECTYLMWLSPRSLATRSTSFKMRVLVAAVLAVFVNGVCKFGK